MKKSSKVEVQKGKIIANPMTMKQMPYNDRVRERDMEMKNMRSGQTLVLKGPRSGKK